MAVRTYRRTIRQYHESRMSENPACIRYEMLSLTSFLQIRENGIDAVPGGEVTDKGTDGGGELDLVGRDCVLWRVEPMLSQQWFMSIGTLWELERASERRTLSY